jgi:L-amino acid N-acyltransferase YncA
MNTNTFITIRTATLSDAQALLNIYSPYVEHTAITFEYDVPSVEEFASRIKNTLQKYPYLVAEKNGRLLGYAYASPFHERPAYDWAVETSIYVDQNIKHQGIGRRLHDALEDALRSQGILNMNACIAYPPEEDEYLDKNSVEFHTHMGYRLVGEFYKCGYKFHRWYNMVWMEKLIGNHLSDQKPPKFPMSLTLAKSRNRKYL